MAGILTPSGGRDRAVQHEQVTTSDRPHGTPKPLAPSCYNFGMTPTESGNPSADIRLPDGTHLTLYRGEKCRRHRDNAELVGDRLVALVPGEPRAVLYFYKSDGKQKVERVESKLPHDQPIIDDRLPEGVQWTFCSIDNPADVTRYTKMYDAIKNHP